MKVQYILLVVALCTCVTSSPAVDNKQRRADNYYECVIDQCNEDWVLYEETCYFFGEALESWADAAETCRATGAKLAEIETAEENSFVKDTAMEKGGDHYWVGGTDILQEGNWTWASAEYPLTFSDWREGEPNDDYRNEDCMELARGHDYQWNDVACDREQKAICEMPVGTTVVG